MWHPAIPDAYKDQIVTGDAHELAKALPDESIDLIFTDPVYSRINDYQWLAETAIRVLRPNSAVLVWCGIGYIPQIHDALRRGGLTYRWRLVIKPVWKLEFYGKLCVGSQECLWYEKGHSNLYESQLDVQMSTVKGDYTVGNANWGKSPQDLWRLTNAFSRVGDIIFDPFTGHGTVPAICKMLGRHYIAFEIDVNIAEQARQHVLSTQPPLLVPGSEQMQIDLTEQL